MKDKRRMVWIISVVCIILAVAFCAVSIVKMNRLQKQARDLETEVARLMSEQNEKQTETLTETEEIKEVKKTKKKKSKKAKKETNTETETEATETGTDTESDVQTEKSTEAQNGHVVAIDPGHQGSWVNMSEQEPSGPGSSEMKAKATTGTQGRYTGVPEYQLNLDISLALQKELENRGYRVVMSRTDNDTAISNSERALKAYEEGGEIYVRIHANGSDDSSVNGALGMTPSYENPYVANLAEESYRLTECILNTYCNETGFNNLGIQYHDDMTGINWSKIPVMILEMGFMTNEHDDTAMQDTDMQAKMVSGIADGIDLYFGDSQ